MGACRLALVKATIWPAVLLVCLAGLPTSCQRPEGNAKEEGTTEEATQNQTPQTAPQVGTDSGENTLVNVTPLKRGPISSYIKVSADIESLYLVDVESELSGLKIVELAVDEGDQVTKGELLVRLDSEEIQLQLRQAEVELEETKTQQAKAAIAVEEAEERHNAALIHETKLKRDYDAALEIAEDGLVSEKELASERLAWEQAVSERQLRALETRNVVLDQSLSCTRVEKAVIARDNLRLRMKRTSITAPIDGCISLRAAEVGQTVTVSTTLFTIVDTQTLIANLYLPQEDINRVQRGMSVSFTCDAYPGSSFSGEVDLISPVVDPMNGTIKIRVRIPSDRNERLRPGMYVNANVLVYSREDARLVTRKAVFYEDEKPCFFYIDEGLARRATFERGASNDRHQEITKLWDQTEMEILLDDGTPIVVVGQDNLKEGDKVKIVEELP